MKNKEMHQLVKTDLRFSTGFPAQMTIRIWFMSGYFLKNKSPSQPPIAFISLLVKLNWSMQTFLCCAMLQIKNLGLGNASLQSFPICSVLSCNVQLRQQHRYKFRLKTGVIFKVKTYSMRIFPFKEPLKSCCENHTIYNESKEEIPITEFII